MDVAFEGQVQDLAGVRRQVGGTEHVGAGSTVHISGRAEGRVQGAGKRACRGGQRGR